MVVEELIRVLQYLFVLGIAEQDDVYCAIAHYYSENEDACREWYKERFGKDGEDIDIASAIEEEVYA